MFKKRVKLSSGVDSKRRKLAGLPQMKEKNNGERDVIESDLTDDEEPKMTNKPGKGNIISTIKPSAVTTTTITTTTTRAYSEISKSKDNIVVHDENPDLSSDEEAKEKSSSQDEMQATIKTFLNPKPKLVGGNRSSRQIKQASNLKATVLVDYQPDICKDFKQTGYCGYGDNCKFLHSRDDFRTGWKLNKDWEAFKEDKIRHNNNKNKNNLEGEAEAEAEGGVEIIGETIPKDVPFKCVICHDNYKNPIVTGCHHYFCNRCFFQRIKDTGNQKCIICGHDTRGSAKVATNLQKILKLQERVK